VVDDFAHHPTAVAATLAGLAGRYAGRRLVVCFEPRSLTAGRRFFQDAYAAAFAAADRLLLAPVHYAERYPAEQLLDLPALAAAVAARGAEAVACADVDEVLARAVDGAREGDVLITMSSGSFAGLPQRLLAALDSRFAASNRT
jgi:UDP-N-acetylmuramate: L-alanyl-gamma-D-glutamyl-meso-diaminopimelate ligase